MHLTTHTVTIVTCIKQKDRQCFASHSPCHTHTHTPVEAGYNARCWPTSREQFQWFSVLSKVRAWNRQPYDQWTAHSTSWTASSRNTYRWLGFHCCCSLTMKHSPKKYNGVFTQVAFQLRSSVVRLMLVWCNRYIYLFFYQSSCLHRLVLA